MKANKYGAVKKEYGGNKYDSKREAQHAANLDLMKRHGSVTNWERQVKLPLAVEGVHICNYIIDFVVTYDNGKVEHQEVKGMETPTWKLKFKLAKALYPDINFRVIK